MGKEEQSSAVNHAQRGRRSGCSTLTEEDEENANGADLLAPNDERTWMGAPPPSSKCVGRERTRR
jgi:hypothetical protein